MGFTHGSRYVLGRNQQQYLAPRYLPSNTIVWNRYGDSDSSVFDMWSSRLQFRYSLADSGYVSMTEQTKDRFEVAYLRMWPVGWKHFVSGELSQLSRASCVRM